MTKVPSSALCLLLACSTACSRTGAPTSEDTNAVLEPNRTPTAELTPRAQVKGGPLDIARASNVRYVGTLPTTTGKHVRPEALLRSGHLAMVNDDGYAELIRLGLKSVIDFRSSSESQAAPDAPWVVRGTRYTVVALPQISADSAQAFGQLLTALEPMLPKVFAHLGAANALPALLHCGTGRGRACAAMAIVLLSLSVPTTEIANDFANNQEVGLDPHWLDGVFTKVASTGGIEAYLMSHGVAAADLASLRAQALE